MASIDLSGFSADTYGEGFADVYDSWYGHITDAEATARFVAERAPVPWMAELGVGSGRLVHALVQQGLNVVGIDSSAAMLKKCQTSTAGLSIQLVQADLANLPLRSPGTQRTGTGFGACLCAFNTLFNLVTEPDQRELLRSAASTLAPEGVLVIEAVTGIEADKAESSVGVSLLEVDRLVLSATVVDVEQQTVTGQHVDITGAGIQLRPWRLRWTTPQQLDELAASVGLRLTERYGGWQGEPFTKSSDVHVSTYQRI